LSLLVLSVIDISMPSYTAARVKLNPSLTSGVFVSGDHRQLEMVVLNLLTNAQNACVLQSFKQHVLVDLHHADGVVILEVTDNGMGVPEDQQQNIFNLFHTTKANGMGVGLWLSREIMHNHQGELELVQSKPGSTCFRFSLPLVCLVAE
jgi:signal transduction histidine kinase